MRQTRIINILIWISIFISSITFFKEPFEGYIHYLVFILLLPVFITRFGISGNSIAILVALLLTGVIEILIGNDTWDLFLKIFIGMTLSIIFYYGVVHYFKMDLDKLFTFYLKGAVLISYIGIIQFFSYYAHFSPGYNYSWLFNKWAFVTSNFGIRINSVFSEASQCAIVLSPAGFIAFLNLLPGVQRYKLTKFESVLILAVIILTTSSTGYIGFFISLFLIILNYGRALYFVMGTAVIIAGGVVLYNNVPEFQSRIDTSMSLWQTEELSTENVNSSSFVLYNNFHIASENFKSNFFFGTGLGSHQIAFDKYSLTKNEGVLDIHFNKADGNSLFVRLLSETGLMGVIFIIVFIIRFYVRKRDGDVDDLWIISNAVLVLIMLYLIRQGNYFLNGLPLFFWIYYFCGKQRKNKSVENSIPANVEQEENTDPVH
ncbi:MAG: O-antigen ligase family protein [Bacteroidetes bacterium]|nr:O-antigen ligase family protein [Bacteroidota bacterium]